MAVFSSFSNSSLARMSRRSISKAELLGSSNARATYLAPTDPRSTRPAVLAPVPQREVGVPAPSEGSSPAKVLSSVMCRWKSPSPPARGGSPPLAEAPGGFPSLFTSLTPVHSLYLVRRLTEDSLGGSEGIL